MNAVQTSPVQADFHLYRNADIEVKKIDSPKGHMAEIVIDGKFQHRFPTTSRVSKHLDLMTPADLQDRLTGGSYFVVDGQLVDFRDGHYHGFTHTDESLTKFMEVLGIQEKNSLPWHRGGAAVASSSRGRKHEGESSIVLKKVWSKNEIIVPGYASGTDFTSQLSFEWNPFAKTVSSAFDLVRLICTNGMVGLTSFLNTKIPLMNRWEEHLDIASMQIQNKVNATVLTRIDQMVKERASVSDCLLLEQHIYDRLHDGGQKEEGERDHLLGLFEAVSASQHLKDVYKFGVFQDKNLSKQLPSHLTNFDIFNVATELRTHTAASKKSSDHALDKFANSKLFDDDNQFVGAKASATGLSAFSSPENAFFGRMAVH